MENLNSFLGGEPIEILIESLKDAMKSLQNMEKNKDKEQLKALKTIGSLIGKIFNQNCYTSNHIPKGEIIIGIGEETLCSFKKLTNPK